MINPTQLNPLTRQQQDVCTYVGVFGVLFSITCIIQLMVYGTGHWLVLVLHSIYLFSAISFFFLSMQKSFAPLLSIITAVLLFFSVIIWMKQRSFSLVLVLFCIYSIATVVYIYIEEIPKKLYAKSLALKAEAALWEGKI